MTNMSTHSSTIARAQDGLSDLPALKPNWTFPEIPQGYDVAAIQIYTSGIIELEYLGEKGWFKKKTIIYSHENGVTPTCEWPWVDGFIPQVKDWRSLGFEVSCGFDSGSAYPNEVKYQSWLNPPKHSVALK